MRTQGKRLALVGSAIFATLAMTAANAAAMNAPSPATSLPASSAAGLTASYGAVVVEPQDPGYAYRSMPALQYVSWKDAAGQTRRRFIRSFQISGDDRSLKTRIQYHAGGSLTETANWKPALDTSGQPLLDRTQFAKVNNVFQDGNGDTVAIDERVAVSGTYGLVAGRHVSNDGGVHWTTELARISLPAGTRHSCSAGRLFQRVIRLPDGTLVMPYYAAHKLVAEPPVRPVVVADQEVAGEVGLGVLAVVGIVPVQVPGAADSDVVQGVAPVLHTMEGGQLMLVFGRPRNKVAYSTNGGVSWSGVYSFYDNLPSGCTTGHLQFPCSSLGSSGYMGVAVTSPRTAYITGDNCHTNWGCAADYTYPHGRDDRLWITTLSLS